MSQPPQNPLDFLPSASTNNTEAPSGTHVKRSSIFAQSATTQSQDQTQSSIPVELPSTIPSSSIPTPSSSNPSDPFAFMPKLEVSYPPDHPMYRRQQARLAAQAQSQTPLSPVQPQITLSVCSPVPSSSLSHLSPNIGSPSMTEQARLLELFSTPLSVPNSPREVARRMSVEPSSRRNSVMAIPPVHEVRTLNEDDFKKHVPESGHDVEVDTDEIQKELDEIETIG
jgi:hypothetical protein